ncbi:DUF2304 domain-containing protein [Larkinella sp. C7]|jgi:hypothetical protein|uniref:DUF2304 domain-containing protein n=1 Tax=Larkinella sp. C7 TaxID=2576607 RepID=UPI0011112208|nr:DUF2304 domain-containing protein [Larkinella sp. C7]
MQSLPITIQLFSIVGTLIFMAFIARLIVRGKLREEYSFVWIVCAIILLVFSVWRDGLTQISRLLGVFYPPSLIFLMAIFAIICFLVHLSVVNSKLQHSIKELTHEIAILKKEVTDMQAPDNFVVENKKKTSAT